jgi:molybdenum cofactor cytidylyltransferase
VRADSLARIAAALGDHDVARPRFEGRGGHPPLIARALWARLAGCAELPGGARAVLAGDGARVIDVPLDDAGVVRDVDTREDADRRRPRPAAGGAP